MLLSTNMVAATIMGLKTKTRRTKGLELVNQNPNEWKLIDCGMFEFPPTGKELKGKEVFGSTFRWKPYGSQNFIKCPYGQPGDVLWVRETWCPADIFDQRFYSFKASPETLTIACDGQTYSIPPIWRPSIHMPKIAARIWLQITDIRVERLQDITDADALAEGIHRESPAAMGFSFLEGLDDTTLSEHVKAQLNEEAYYFYPCKDLRDDSYISKPATSFTSLWASINGWESWNANPWVWVISFKVLSKTGKPAEIGKEVSHV